MIFGEKTKFYSSDRTVPFDCIRELSTQVFMEGLTFLGNFTLPLQFFIYPIPSPIAQSLKSYFAATSGTVVNNCIRMMNLIKEDFIHILRCQSTGFSRGSSKYRGVTLHKCGCWEEIMCKFLDKTSMHLGLFNNKIEDARWIGWAGVNYSMDDLNHTALISGHPSRPASKNAFDENTSALGSADDELAHLYGVTSSEAAHQFSIRRSKSLRMTKNYEMSGKVTYNGHSLEEFTPQRTSAYASQQNLHICEMTVKGGS
ncbi:hypothetical protein ACS0TY_022823 [Phlomoides rotata]